MSRFTWAPIMRSLGAARRRTLLGAVGLSVVMAGAGWWAGQAIESPAEAAAHAQPPAASQITVPVERRVIQTSVVVRGTVRFAAQFDLTVDTDLGDGSLGQLVLTGKLPTAGESLAEGAVAVEVSGRPVFVLQGTLPMYRAMRPGSTGDDVTQLESALSRLGFFSGPPDKVYDQATAAAVQKLYAKAGYAAVGASAAEQQQRAALTAQRDSAHSQRVAAENALAQARGGPPQSAILAAQGKVEQAQLAVDAAQQAYDEALAAADPTATATAYAQLEEAKNRLAVAQAELAELTAPADTTALQQAVDDAVKAETAAQTALDQLSATLGYRVPRGEVVFVPTMPRLVGQVSAAIGDQPSGPVLSLTAPTVQVDIALSAKEKELVKVGAAVTLDDAASQVNVAGTVTFIADAAGTDGVLPGSFYARIEPTGVDPKQLAGLNLRVTIPVESTGGAVLAVPVAALVTDASGTVTVRVRAADGTTRDVVVTAGLSADGFAQVTPVSGELREGDLVVVGGQW